MFRLPGRQPPNRRQSERVVLTSEQYLGVAAEASALREKLNSWTWRNMLDLPRSVAAAGPIGSELLAEQLRRRTAWLERVFLAAVLGDARGSGGIEELRACTRETGPHTVDLRCASLLALTKRIGPDATPDLQAALSDRNRAVRDYALICLAARGDASAWETVLTELARRVRVSSKGEHGGANEPEAVHYLVRTADANGRRRLGELLKKSWDRLMPEFKERLIRFWPSLTPGEPLADPDFAVVADVFPEPRLLTAKA